MNDKGMKKGDPRDWALSQSELEDLWDWNPNESESVEEVQLRMLWELQAMINMANLTSQKEPKTSPKSRPFPPPPKTNPAPVEPLTPPKKERGPYDPKTEWNLEID